MAEFFAMGGYAPYIWGAYGLTALVLIALVVMSLRALRGHEKTLARLENLSPRRRRRGERKTAPEDGNPTEGHDPKTEEHLA